MAKIIKYENNAKQKILAGVEKLEKAVSITLGPAGKNVIIDEFGSIHSTKDGVTVAKSIVLKDPFENLGANAIKEVAQKSNDKVGDGTTTSTLLAATIYKNGLKYVSLGSNATQIKNGIMKASKKAVELVKNQSVEIKSKEDIKKVCTVSANGDEKIGIMISNVMDKIGKDGVIKVEDGQTTEMTSKIVEGMVLDNGYVSPWMVTNQETNEADFDNPFILLVNKKISNIKEFVPALQSVSEVGKPLLIIADDYADDITATLVMNKMRGFNCVAVKSPSYGDNRKAMLNDIAILTGGKVVSDDTGIKLQQATVDSGVIGSAKRVLVTKDSTVIFDGFGDKTVISEHIETIRKQIDNTTDKYDKEKLQERLGKLANGIGVIQVGADTEIERKELRDRVDDAFAAAKAAVKSGIVAGGGVALLDAKIEIEKIIANDSELSGDELVGAKILIDSLDSPIKKILANAGDNAEMIVAKISDQLATVKDSASTTAIDESQYNVGYDALNKRYCNMIESGIIDPTEVVVNEIQNAASVAGLLLTTEALIVEEQTENNKSSCNCNNSMM